MPDSELRIRQVHAGEAHQVATLFALYRQFYGKPYDEVAAETFLVERLRREESVVLLAERTGEGPVGFTQLYPGFSSVSAAPAWVLGDLYVVPSARNGGVAAALMQHAERVARAAGAVSLTLETGRDNHAAQRLYERQGYAVESGFLHYQKPLT